MRVGLAADHQGFDLKERILIFLRESGFEVIDYGDLSLEPEDDYPDFVVPLARAVSRREVDRGIAICGSGVGACIVANKIRKVRAGIIHDIFSSRQGVEDDDMNMICLGAHLETASRAEALVQCFLDSRFSEQPRHRRRLEKISNLEKEW